MNSIYKFILITTAIHFTGCFYLTTGYAQLPHSLSETATPVVKTYNRTSTSSTYPPLNAEWYYRVQSMGGVIPGYISYQHSKIVNDTIILSKNCMVLERTNLLSICESMGRVYEFIYKGHDTLYWFNQDINEYTILYVFSAQQGESWTVDVKDCSFQVDVDSVHSEIINGKEHKVIFIHDFNNYFSGKIIEDIGHTTSFFPKDIYWNCNGLACDSDIINGLRCYITEDTVRYQGINERCDTTYFVFNKVTENQICDVVNIIPNPAGDFIVVNNKNGNLSLEGCIEYKIINLQGLQIRKGMMKNGSPIFINDLPAGVYLIKIQTKTMSTLFNFKFIKQ